MRRLLAAVAMVGAVLVGQMAPAAAETTGSQSFTVILSDDDSTVFGSGPVSGLGTFQEEPDEDQVTLVFDEGSVTLNTNDTDESESFNEFACFGTFRFSGEYSIASGTGDYAEATGSGTYSGRGFFIGERTDEGCSEEGGRFFLIVNTSGTTTLP